jgi:hypothetical protein
MFNAVIAGIAGNEITIGPPYASALDRFSMQKIESSVLACVPGDHGVKKSRPVGRWPNRPRFVA